MPEAVIAAAARTPIGRAGKGSLDGRPPGRPARVRDQGGGRPGRRARSGRDRRRDGRLRLPAGEAGDEPRPPRRAARRAAQERAGHDREPLLRLVAADRAHGVPRDQGGRGRRLRRRGRRVDLPGRRLPEGLRGAAPEARRRGRDRERLHPDGPHRRERRRALRRLARRHGPLRAALAGARGRGAGVRLLRTRADAVHEGGRHGRRPPTTARAPRRRSRSCRSSSRPSSRTAASRPATRARSTTAPRRS